MMRWNIGIAALMIVLFAAVPASAQSYRYGDYANEVSIIQEALEELDLYYADITGHYGRKTERAVKLFQKKYGLTQTGIADETTLEKLYLAAGIEDAPDVSRTDGLAAYGPSTVLRRNSSGAAVRRLQEDLHALDFYDGVISGNYGGLTQEAVRRFQKKHGLDADGIAGPRTLEKIAALMMEKNGLEWPEEEEMRLPAVQSGSVLLRFGMKGDAVMRLQKDLDELGFYNGTITGSYGNLTKEAVRRFQKEHGLASDGIAGPITLARIQKELAEDGEEDEQEEAHDSDENEDEDEEEAAISLDDVELLNTSVTLRRSSRSGYVTRLQRALTALGYFDEKCDGYFGSDTEAAVILYQKARGLTADGIAGRATLSSINQDIKDGVTADEVVID